LKPFEIQADETALLRARAAVHRARVGFRMECEDRDGAPDPANRDCWGTFWVNARGLQEDLAGLISILNREFGEG
jgi:hypothetical protein